MIEFYLIMSVGAIALAFVLMWLNHKITQAEKLNAKTDRDRGNNTADARDIPDNPPDDTAAKTEAQVRAPRERS